MFSMLDIFLSIVFDIVMGSPLLFHVRHLHQILDRILVALYKLLHNLTLAIRYILAMRFGKTLK